MEDTCVLCNKPLGSIVRATHPCPESVAGIALRCAAWRAETELTPRRDDPPLLNMWEAYQHSPPVPWRLLLRQPFVLWSLFVLVGLFLHEVMRSVCGW